MWSLLFDTLGLSTHRAHPSAYLLRMHIARHCSHRQFVTPAKYGGCQHRRLGLASLDMRRRGQDDYTLSL
jgi:hypothetical protein